MNHENCKICEKIYKANPYVTPDLIISTFSQKTIFHRVEKGAQAEIDWMNELADYNPLFKGKESYAGDFVLKKDNYTLMIEIKNYTNKIPAKEVTKFYRDVQNYTGGLFIANQPIVGKKSFHVEKNCIFITTHNVQLARAAIEYLFTKWKASNKVIFKDKWFKIKKNINVLVENVDKFEKLKINLNNLREQNQKALNQIYFQVLEIQANLKFICDEIVNKSALVNCETQTQQLPLKTNQFKMPPQWFEICDELLNIINRFLEKKEINKVKVNFNSKSIEINFKENQFFLINFLKTKVNIHFNIFLPGIESILKFARLSKNILIIGLTKKESFIISAVSKYFADN